MLSTGMTFMRAGGQHLGGAVSERIYGWLDGLLPTALALILDIGAGTGRDAAWLASLGHDPLMRCASRASGCTLSQKTLGSTIARLTFVATLRLDLAFDIVSIERRVDAPRTRRSTRGIAPAGHPAQVPWNVVRRLFLPAAIILCAVTAALSSGPVGRSWSLKCRRKPARCSSE
jgi:hypothetical protein